MFSGRISGGTKKRPERRNSIELGDVRVVALVARDRRLQTNSEHKFQDRKKGFAPHFESVFRAIERAEVRGKKAVDLVVFSLWSHDFEKLGKLTFRHLFPSGTTHRAVLLEVRQELNEFWVRKGQQSKQFKQQFGRSKQRSAIADFVNTGEMLSRQFGNALPLFCGESNVISTERKSKRIIDEFGIFNKFDRHGIRIILNPIHDYMNRYEMKLKRKALSRNGRVVVSVWNRGHKAREAKDPWTVFFNGKEVTSFLRELNEPVEGQPGVRISVLDIKELPE